ncbi:hypothetical protein N7499_000030 [Penicillium canescens]|uniref:NmrA-like domain-containing protein n=1 Tax=Penicillium canescens TaxID=5083 RepID=A0AAD6IG32_PENCN|nr:uncharacterized protein N7446_011772 [Penicillium canescens]KAJ6003961.1 hypothetical protein N7522_005606 [Penicillium canescens]KAJ6028890.1 hypothetical protein N7444_011877 [Penicillium canescens]KAJ6047323.1 hypothetical protein N7460_003470 [Penicillium canescens]KAJ6049089.1 hypothetical protein N7446_011772 [Penicillium canescens]KAJ6100400.1 hypothetical protein N7499_000030 [Penicillium canescens]
MSFKKVAVFPASGGIGGSTVKHLLPRFPSKDLIFIARHPERLSDALSSSATVRRADYDDDSSLSNAFEGVDTLFLISYASVEHEHRSERHRFAINAAIRSGVKHIFYGSLGYGGKPENKESVAHVMQAHLDTEKYLEQMSEKNPGFGYTVVREGLYTESYPLYTAFFDPKNPVGEIKIPHDGSGPGIAWVKREELGEGTAELLKRFVNDPKGFPYLQRTVLLSGRRVVSLKESVDILGKVANLPVKIRQVSEDEFAAQPQVKPNLIYHGVDHSKVWTTTFEAFRRGEAAYASPLLGELLGREPEGFETTVTNS